MVMAVLLSTEKAFCEATAVQALYTLVQPTVAVEKMTSVEVGNINPSNGNASELKSSFNLQSNDEQTFFVVYSKITILGGTQVSAFDLKDIKCQVMLSNTYHLHLRPGDDVEVDGAHYSPCYEDQ